MVIYYMIRMPYSYKSFPNSPRATEYSHSRERSAAFFSGAIGILSFSAVVTFFITAFSLFSNGNWDDFLYVLLFVLIVALLDAYFFVLRSHNTECNINIILLKESPTKPENYEEIIKVLKKENRKRNIIFLTQYFLYFFLGMFIAISIVGIIQAAILLSNGKSATVLLLLSILALIVFGCLFFFALPIGRECFQKLFTKEKKYSNP